MEDKEYFDFLDGLRESGAVNMFGAAPYLMQQFDLNQREAKVILIKWSSSNPDRSMKCLW